MKKQLTILLFLIFSGSSFAQDYLISKDSTKFPPVELDEIQVKAEKQQDKLQHLPLSVTAISGAKVESQQIRSLKGISAQIPNFFMPDYGSKLTSPVYLRGIGSRINSPSVGLYVDNVPYFEKAAFDFEFFDIERIEVLRGPQGTLYGRNTMGGIINIYTKEPERYRETRLSFDAGNYQNFKTMLYHNQPLGESWNVVLSGVQAHHGGFHTNDFNEQKVDELESYSGRIKTVFQPSQNFKTQWVVSMETSQQGGYPYAVFDTQTMESAPINYNQYSSYERDLLSSSLSLEYKKPNFVINSMTSYQFLDDCQKIDQDFMPQNFFFVRQAQKQHTLAQEVNIHSRNPERYKWIFGAFAFTQLFDRAVDVDYGEDAISAYNLPGAMSKYKLYDHSISGAALFHQSTLKNFPAKKLALTAGIRIDYEKSILDYRYDMTLNGSEIPKDAFESDLEYFEILPKVALKYQLSENFNSYLSVAKGYKTGGFNSTIERDEDRTFDPELSWNYELGFKTKFLKNRISANLSLFYIDWKNQQIYQPVPSGQGSMLKNAGKSVSKGAELELISRPMRYFKVVAGFGYTDARFVKYQRDENRDYSGNFIPYIPKFTLNVGSFYSFVLKNKILKTIQVQVNYRHIGKHYWNEENSSFQSDYGLLNSQISFDTRYVSLGFWAKNILSSSYHSFYFEALGNAYVQKSPPALFGVSLDVRF